MFPEKSLEHYVASELLKLENGEVYLDIASCNSPAADVYANLFGVDPYIQDLSYPSGLHGNVIGSDAANMPIPSSFADKMALHCSLEHFEGDADIRFITEALRVLKKGGRVCILPLYTSDTYSISTDPVVAVNENVPFEDGVLLECIENWNNRHGRRYDAKQFISRIYKQIPSDTAAAELYEIIGCHDIAPNCYLDLALLITKKI